MVALGLAATLLAGVGVLTVINQTVFTNQLLTSDFRKGSGPFVTKRTPDYLFDVTNGTYRIQALTTEAESGARTFAYFARRAYLVDLVAEVASVSPESSIGVACLARTSPATGYALLALTSGGVGLARLDEKDAPVPIAADGRLVVPTTDLTLGLSCRNESLMGSSVSLTGYVNGREVISGTDEHGLSGFDAVGLLFANPAPGTEVRFRRVAAGVTGSTSAPLMTSPSSSPSTTTSSIGATTTPTSVAPKAANVVFETSLRQNDHGWPEDRDETDTETFDNGGYHVVITRDTTLTPYPSTAPRGDSVSVEATAKVLGRNGQPDIGLFCRQAADGKSFYEGGISSNGNWAIFKWVKDKSTAMKSGTIDATITRFVATPGATNRIRFDCEGAAGAPVTLTLSVNGAAIGSVAEKVGLGAGTYGLSQTGVGSDVVWSNFRVTKLAGFG